jgi:hypothetical protein
MAMSTWFNQEVCIRLTEEERGFVWTVRYRGIPLRSGVVSVFGGARAALDPECQFVERPEPDPRRTGDRQSHPDQAKS